jgi:multidrug resistance efflux pump
MNGGGFRYTDFPTRNGRHDGGSGAAILSSLAEAERAEADRRRYDALVAPGAVARRDANIYRTTAIEGEG